MIIPKKTSWTTFKQTNASQLMYNPEQINKCKQILHLLLPWWPLHAAICKASKPISFFKEIPSGEAYCRSSFTASRCPLPAATNNAVSPKSLTSLTMADLISATPPRRNRHRSDSPRSERRSYWESALWHQHHHAAPPTGAPCLCGDQWPASHTSSYWWIWMNIEICRNWKRWGGLPELERNKVCLAGVLGLETATLLASWSWSGSAIVPPLFLSMNEKCSYFPTICV